LLIEYNETATFDDEAWTRSNYHHEG